MHTTHGGWKFLLTEKKKVPGVLKRKKSFRMITFDRQHPKIPPPQNKKICVPRNIFEKNKFVGEKNLEIFRLFLRFKTPGTLFFAKFLFQFIKTSSPLFTVNGRSL